MEKGKLYKAKLACEMYFKGRYTDDFDDAAILTNDKSSLIVPKADCIEICQAKEHNDDIRLCGQCIACGGAVAVPSSVLLANELLPHVSQLLIDFNKWQQVNIHFVLKLDEKELAEEFIKSINCG